MKLAERVSDLEAALLAVARHTFGSEDQPRDERGRYAVYHGGSKADINEAMKSGLQPSGLGSTVTPEAKYAAEYAGGRGAVMVANLTKAEQAKYLGKFDENTNGHALKQAIPADKFTLMSKSELADHMASIRAERAASNPKDTVAAFKKDAADYKARVAEARGYDSKGNRIKEGKPGYKSDAEQDWSV